MFTKEIFKCHSISLQNTVFIVAFTILPLMLGILSTIMFSELKSLSPFYAKGEFFLYSVSLLSSTYISYNTIGAKRKIFDGWVNIILFLLLVIVSACYAFIISNDSLPRIEIVKSLSFGGFFLALPLFYYSQFLINKRSPDLIEFRKNEQDNIEQKLS